LNVTLSELTLLTARGSTRIIRTRKCAGHGAEIFDDIVGCFQEWAVAALETSTKAFASSIQDFLATASNAGRPVATNLYGLESTQSLQMLREHRAVVLLWLEMSPHIVGYILNVSSISTTCPSDSLSPVPSIERRPWVLTGRSWKLDPTMIDTIRRTLLRQSLVSLLSLMGKHRRSFIRAD
jgi:hypothetical protein